MHWTRFFFLSIVPDAPDEAVDLFKQFVKYDSAKRICAKDALKHKYFSIPPFAASLDDMPKPKEKRSFAQKNQQEIQPEVSFNEMFTDLFDLASKWNEYSLFIYLLQYSWFNIILAYSCFTLKAIFIMFAETIYSNENVL